MKPAFIFSGQGAQNTGMGKELCQQFPVCKRVFNEADESLGFSISKVCFDESESEKLNMTEYSQPAILTLSFACYQLMKESGFDADFFTGLSLGEYSALTAAGAFDFADAVRLVNKRGKFMAEAVPFGVGAMSAIMGLDNERLEKACFEAEGYVVCANYNAPEQIVIAGEANAVADAERIAMSYGAKRAIRLNVSGPFHTDLLAPAAEQLRLVLDETDIKDFEKQVISNIDALPINGKNNVKETLLKQIVSPVKWEQSVEYLLAQGVDCFVELGPGKVLSGFVKKIDKNASIYNIEDIKSFEKTMQSISNLEAEK